MEFVTGTQLSTDPRCIDVCRVHRGYVVNYKVTLENGVHLKVAHHQYVFHFEIIGCNLSYTSQESVLTASYIYRLP